MEIDKNEFFKEVTLRICSSLQVNTAFSRVFEYLREHLPLDHMFLDITDTSLGANRHIAFATVGKKTPEEIIPLPKEIWNWVKELRVPMVLTPSNMDKKVQVFAQFIRLHKSSDLVVPLRIEEELIGFLILRARGQEPYTQEHVELLSSVAEPFAVALANALAHEAVLQYRDVLLDDNRFLNRELHNQSGAEIIGGSAGLRQVMDMVRQVAPLSNTVLLLGETGTGKEVIANAIHMASPRKDGPFIKVNCGAIPESLIDSELFGHEKGAFTGSLNDKRGRFERANGGTIFLDEIGELPLQAQVRLLRVLQTHEVERVGGDQSIPVNIRVIAATHRNLQTMVSEGTFREDLWFRLNVFPINIPRLRDRREDIPALVRHFLEAKSRELAITPIPAVAPGALEKLVNYAWPGNVRELENLIERELIQNRSGQLHFNSLLSDHAVTRYLPVQPAGESITTLDEAMAAHIVNALTIAKGKIEGQGGAAELLGINSSTLRARMKKLGVEYGRVAAQHRSSSAVGGKD